MQVFVDAKKHIIATTKHRLILQIKFPSSSWEIVRMIPHASNPKLQLVFHFKKNAWNRHIDSKRHYDSSSKRPITHATNNWRVFFSVPENDQELRITIARFPNKPKLIGLCSRFLFFLLSLAFWIVSKASRIMQNVRRVSAREWEKEKKLPHFIAPLLRLHIAVEYWCFPLFSCPIFDVMLSFHCFYFIFILLSFDTWKPLHRMFWFCKFCMCVTMAFDDGELCFDWSWIAICVRSTRFSPNAMRVSLER